MTVGERIKRIRTFRHMTMEEFGNALGFEGKSASVRVAQYESGTRVPKTDMLREMAKILNCSYDAFKDYNEGSAEDILETLFWLDETNDIWLFEVPTSPSIYSKKGRNKKESDSDNPNTPFNEDDFSFSDTPIGITFNFRTLNEFINAWYKKKNELKNGDITRDEYFEWKINWPYSDD